MQKSIHDYQVYCFDIDGTLAGSYDAISADVAGMLCGLLKKGKTVVFVTGRMFSSADSRFGDVEYKVLTQLPCYPECAQQIYTIASGGAHMLEYKGDTWKDVFAKRIPDEEIARMIDVYEAALPKALDQNDPALRHKSRHVNKGNLLLSCTSIEPTEEGADVSRKGWDDNREKRRRIRNEMYKSISAETFDIHIGGGTTLDISHKGVNKKSALEALFVHTGIAPEQTVFIGDGFGEGGNDEVVRGVVDVVEVTEPNDVLRLFNQD